MTKTYKSYSEKLKDPRWQRKRLEVLNRDNFTCQYCKSDQKTLHVHHWTYEQGKEPWEYELKNFATLCEDCHFIEEKHFKNSLLRVLYVSINEKESGVKLFHVYAEDFIFGGREVRTFKYEGEELKSDIRLDESEIEKITETFKWLKEWQG